MINKRLNRLFTNPQNLRWCEAYRVAPANLRTRAPKEKTYTTAKNKRKRTKKIVFFNLPTVDQLKLILGKILGPNWLTFEKREHEKYFK